MAIKAVFFDGCARVILLALALGLSVGCAGRREHPNQFTRRTPPPFQGPEFIQGTVGSYAGLSNGDPLIVSGIGVVVGLQGTGSNIIPPEWRQRVMNMVRRGGVKNPEQFLATSDTAVVFVEALIPPGATKGLPIDLLVSTVPQTQVTSLAGGKLWSMELSLLGTNPTMVNRTLAIGRGPLYVNPFDTTNAGDAKQEATQAVVIGGGVVMEDRVVELVLRQPNFNLSRAITDRINERFPRQIARRAADPMEDRLELADAKSDSVIRLHVPKRFANDPQRLLTLLMHLYIERGPQFEEHKARELAEVLRANPIYAEYVIPAWEALGKSVLVGLRAFYNDETPHVQLAALEAAARLGDQKAVDALVALSESTDAKERRKAADLLGFLSDNIKSMRVLRKLVDDSDLEVRLAAYESLAAMGDVMVRRTVFENKATGIKLILDLVPSEQPMIYIAQAPLPRVVIFNPMLGFKDDQLITLWEGRLMLRREGDSGMKVFYQKRGDVRGNQWPTIAPAVANLVVLLAHEPTMERPMPGADMDFGQIANVLYTLWNEGHIPSGMHLQLNPLSARLAVVRAQPTGPRPEFSPEEVEEQFEPGDKTAPTGVEPGESPANNEEAFGFREGP